jgi:hypothetical protein
MPVLPPVPGAYPTQTFWSVLDIIELARILANDAQGGLSGQELADTNPQVWPLLNLCYAKMCNALEDSNVEAATTTEAIVGPLAGSPQAAIDPTTQSQLTYLGFWNGDPNTEMDANVTLPLDLIQPLKLWERPAGSNLPFAPMMQNYGGLESRWGVGFVVGGTCFGRWEFRSVGGGVNAICLPAINTTQEIRIRYIPSLAILQKNEDGTYPQVQLARTGEALAYALAAEWAEIRGAANAPNLRAKYEDQIRIITNKTAKRENVGFTRPSGYAFGRNQRRGWYW